MKLFHNADNPYGCGGTCIYKPASAELLKEFADVAPIFVDDFNYLRAETSREVIDLYNITYVISSAE